MQLLDNCGLLSSLSPMSTGKQLLTSTQVAEIFNVERTTVIRKAQRGEIPIAAEIEDRRGKQLMFDPADIRAIAEAEIERRRQVLESVAGAA